MFQPILKKLGFDPGRLRFTLRTAFGSCVGILLAWLIGLEHPQWAGMSVWSASQPIRGHLLEKGLFRAAGTVLGSAFGILLLILAEHNQWLIVVGLAIWIALCAAAANLVKGFVSYGTVTAGYTAAMVSLLHSSHSASPFAVGFDRMLTVLTGVAVALVFGWLFTKAADMRQPAQRVGQLSRRVLDDLSSHLSGEPLDHRELTALLSEIAAVEDDLEGRSAGSLKARQAVKTTRRILLAQVAILLWMRRPLSSAHSGPLVENLALAAKMIDGPDQRAARTALQQAMDQSSCYPDLRKALGEFTVAATNESAALDLGDRTEDESPIALHRDWVGAREAFIRTALILLAVGSLWLATGWYAGTFMVLATSVMATVFAAADNPPTMLRQALLGQPLAVICTLICRWLLWPMAGSEIELILFMFPFILLGGLMFAQKRTAGPAFEYNMVVMLLLQPALPLTGTFQTSLSVGAAVVLGPAASLAAYMLLFPVNPRLRMQTLFRTTIHEIEAMASQKGLSPRRQIWQARLYHRVLRLVRWADKTGHDRDDVIKCSYALLQAGSAILHLDDIMARPSLPKNVAKRLEAARTRLRNLGQFPQKAVKSVAAAAETLSKHQMSDDAELMRETALELSGAAMSIKRIGGGTGLLPSSASP